MLVMIVGIILTSIAADHAGVFGYRGDDWKAFDKQRFFVSKIVDGDTVYIHSLANPTSETKVRLLGIDAPEMSAEGGLPAYWAEQATTYLRVRALHQSVIVRLESTKTRDKYGRLLAYLYLSESDDLNLDCVRDGQAYADRRFRHSLQTQFEQAEGAARKARSGLWKDVRDDQMPEWRRRWLAEWQARKSHPSN